MKKTIIAVLGLLILAQTSRASGPGAVQETYDISKSESTVKWTGYHLAKSYEHWGYVKVKSGEVEIVDDEVVGGNITIDMKSITSEDVTDSDKNKKLVDDLKSDQFFYTKKHSTATLVITKTELSESGGSTVYADITIRGITQPITFELMTEEDDDQIILTAELNVDRSKHEVLYGWSLENAIISGEFLLEVKLVLEK